MKRQATYRRLPRGVGRTTRVRRKTSAAPIRKEVKTWDCAGIPTINPTATWINTKVAWSEFADSDGAIDNSKTAELLIPSENGSGYGQVNGSAYLIKKLHVRGSISINPVASLTTIGDPSVDYRILLVRDTQPNGVQQDGAFVMQDFTIANADMFIDRAETVNRFKILKEQRGVINLVATPPTFVAVDPGPYTQTSTAVFSKDTFDFVYVPSSDFEVRLAPDQAHSVAALVNENIFLLVWCDLAMSVRFQSRCYYCDL